MVHGEPLLFLLFRGSVHGNFSQKILSKNAYFDQNSQKKGPARGYSLALKQYFHVIFELLVVLLHLKGKSASIGRDILS